VAAERRDGGGTGAAGGWRSPAVTDERAIATLPINGRRFQDFVSPLGFTRSTAGR
jgi:hypothetical protein